MTNGDKVSNNRRNYDGFENTNFKVLGDTGKTVNGQQVVIALNKHNGEYEERKIQDIKNMKASGYTERTSQIKNNLHGFQKKGKLWQSRIRIQGKTFSLGSFLSKRQATFTYDKALNDWLCDGKYPSTNFLNPQNDNSIGEKYIHFAKNRSKPYVFEKITDGKRTCKYFLTINEAITYRDSFLKQQLKENN